MRRTQYPRAAIDLAARQKHTLSHQSQCRRQSIRIQGQFGRPASAVVSSDNVTSGADSHLGLLEYPSGPRYQLSGHAPRDGRVELSLQHRRLDDDLRRGSPSTASVSMITDGGLFVFCNDRRNGASLRRSLSIRRPAAQPQFSGPRACLGQDDASGRDAGPSKAESPIGAAPIASAAVSTPRTRASVRSRFSLDCSTLGPCLAVLPHQHGGRFVLLHGSSAQIPSATSPRCWIS